MPNFDTLFKAFQALNTQSVLNEKATICTNEKFINIIKECIDVINRLNIIINISGKSVKVPTNLNFNELILQAGETTISAGKTELIFTNDKKI